MDAARKTAVAAWTVLRDVVLNDEEERKQVSRALDITYFKVKVVLKLSGGALSASQLVHDLASDKTYISLVLRDLEEDGTVERVTALADRRYKDIVLTPAGHALASRAKAILDQPPASFSNLTPDELDNLLRLATKISAA